MLVHMLNPCGVWDLLPLLARGQPRAARRRARQRERTVVIGGRPVRHYLSTPAEAHQRFFARCFRLVGAYGSGVFLPPPTAHKVQPAMLPILGRLDSALGCRLHNWGRFFVLDLVRR